MALLALGGPALGQTCKYASIPATAPASRFADNADGTVTDRGSGLQWKRCVEGQTWDGSTCTGGRTAPTWDQALQLAQSVSFAGKDDWRLPNLKELASIVELACSIPAIDLAVFPAASPAYVWSSTPTQEGSAPAWTVNFSLGFEGTGYWGAGNPLVRLVRGGRIQAPTNDTGLDWWGDGSGAHLVAEPADYPGQDASRGRDRWYDDDGDDHAGFRLTKLDAAGLPLPGSAATWACVRDEATGLIWEVKTGDGGLRDRDWWYLWYNPSPTDNGGSAGSPDGVEPGPWCSGVWEATCNHCFDPDRCDTAKYVEDVNAEGLCGASDWRLPAREELRSIVDNSRVAPAIDADWLGPTAPYTYWSASPYAGSADRAWQVSMHYGLVLNELKSLTDHVRLVRGARRQSWPAAAVGVWRPQTRRFLLDCNGNGRWDGEAGGDRLTAAFGLAADLPVSGDWDGDGRAEVGTWRPGDRRFRLDIDADGRWDGAVGGDRLSAPFGVATDLPLVGDWNGDGRAELGYWRPQTRRFSLDSNGNGRWDGTSGGDTLTPAFGLSADLPVSGDWSGDGLDEIGTWRPSDRRFRLDTNGNGRWDGVAGGDTLTAAFGLATDLPVTGDWDGDGSPEVGFRRPGTRRFQLDTNGNDRWDGPTQGDWTSDSFGSSGDRPVVGPWGTGQ
jgi:hypothetical protein